jgi:hypothetical protein
MAKVQSAQNERLRVHQAGTHNIFVIAISSRFRGSVQNIARSFFPSLSILYSSIPLYGLAIVESHFEHFHSSSSEHWWLDCY